MTRRSFRLRALVAIFSMSLCGCAVVGLGYRAEYKHRSNRSEAARLTELAQLYERQGRSEGALRLYRQALRTDPRSRVAHERLMALSGRPQTPQAAPSLPGRGVPETALAQRAARAASGAAPTTPAPSPATPMPSRTLVAGSPPPKPVHVESVAAAPPPAPPAATAAAPAPLSPEPSKVVAPSVEPVATSDSTAGPTPMEMPGDVAQELVEPRPFPAPMEQAGPVREFGAPPESRPAEDVSEESRPAVVAVPRVRARAELRKAFARRETSSIPALTDLLAESSAEIEAPAVEAQEVKPAPALALPTVAPSIDADGERHVQSWAKAQNAAPMAASVEVSATPVAEVTIRPQPVEPTAAPGFARVDTPAWSATRSQDLSTPIPDEFLPLVLRVRSADPLVRKDALFELSELGVDAAPVVDVVRPSLHDADLLVRAHAAWAIHRIAGADEECLQALSGVLRCEDSSAAALAAYCLGLMGASAEFVTAELQSVCETGAPEVQLCAAEALLKITPDAAEPVAVLFAALRDSQPRQRWLSALALSAVSAEYRDAAVLALIPALTDADPDVAASAALALGAMGPAAEAAAPELERLRTHAEIDVREAASAALACIGR